MDISPTIYYATEIIQWGNLHFKRMNNPFINGYDSDFPKEKRYLIIPDSPITGVEDVTVIQNSIINNYIIDKIPDNWLTLMQNLLTVNAPIYAAYQSDVDINLIKEHPLTIGNNVCKNLKKLISLESFVAAPIIEKVGNSIFEGCENLTNIRFLRYSATADLDLALEMHLPVIKTVGKNFFKDCKKLNFSYPFE